MRNSRWKEPLEMKRRGKDRFFQEDPRSPIPIREREKFEGLSYFAFDPKYRFELELFEHDEKKTVSVETTHGGRRDLLRWGEFRFKIGDEECALQTYQTNPREGRLFIPFRDETSGAETADMGRYLDLEPEIHRTSEGEWILDFNEAYNPWCEYSDDYTCPFPPPENWLRPAVRAGEMSYSK
jgi:uncharacterized protein (DUF1684 family)